MHDPCKQCIYVCGNSWKASFDSSKVVLVIVYNIQVSETVLTRYLFYRTYKVAPGCPEYLAFRWKHLVCCDSIQYRSGTSDEGWGFAMPGR